MRNLWIIPALANIIPVESTYDFKNTAPLSCPTTQGSPLRSDVGWAFSDALVRTDDTVIFVPFSADCIAVFNPVTNALSCVQTAPLLTDNYKFMDAALRDDDTAVFAPLWAGCVGILSPTNIFQCIDITTADQTLFIDTTGVTPELIRTMEAQFGASPYVISDSDAILTKPQFVDVAVFSDNTAIFAPLNSNCIGLLSPGNIFSCVDAGQSLSVDFDSTFFLRPSRLSVVIPPSLPPAIHAVSASSHISLNRIYSSACRCPHIFTLTNQNCLAVSSSVPTTPPYSLQGVQIASPSYPMTTPPLPPVLIQTLIHTDRFQTPSSSPTTPSYSHRRR